METLSSRTTNPGDKCQVVWFKNDLRTCDNACLVAASNGGPILPILIIEPEFWALPDTSWRLYEHRRQAVASLRKQLAALGASLQIRTGDVIAALEDISEEVGDFDLWAHQETGNYWTYMRDRMVRTWAKKSGVSFTEPMQHGVWRCSRLDRDKWAKEWDAMMGQSLLPLPVNAQWANINIDGFGSDIPAADVLGLEHDGIVGVQPGGRAAALATLDSFLHRRGKDYRTDMSSPILGITGCSRLSVHLVTGAVSMRECYQATTARIADLKGDDSADAKAWRASLSSFIGRLHWHCHFTQKLESEPEMEFRPVARVYEGMRPPASEEWKQAYAEGRTGFPFVDACMRSLKATGWINFRMRAMLMSFACYDLFMPWQEAGAILGKLFTDYEPGIHWTQSQMQSGETGINTLRIYSPVKQGKDFDLEGQFISRWVPELAGLDAAAIHEPWLHGSTPEYPAPLVDHSVATKAARSAIWEIRKTPEAKAEAADVLLRHGSRRRPPKRRRAKPKVAAK